MKDFKSFASASFSVDDKFYNFNENVEKAASKVGCKVVLPQADQLLIDIDNDEAFDYFLRRIEEFDEKTCEIVTYEAMPSKSDLPHRHVYVTVHGYIFDDWERIALQTMLGSDPVREGLNAL